MQLGVFSLTDIAADPFTAERPTATQRVADIVEYAIAADKAGLDVFGLGEHHTLDFAVSSPAVVLGAIAQATTTIILTSAVSVLSVLDPVRLYQDFAAVDLLSQGRAEITVGRSAFTEPFPIFGVDLADYDDVFEEKLDLLLRLRDSDHVTWRGRFRPPLDNAPIAPRAHSEELAIRIGIGGTPASAIRAGRLGLPMTLGLIGGSPARAKPLFDLYRQAGHQSGQPEEKLKAGLVSHFLVAPTSQGARDTLFPYYRDYLAPKTPGGRGFVVDRASFDELAGPRGAVMVGSPQEVIDKILYENDLFDLDRFMGQVDLGGLPHATVLESIDLFATEVAPVIRKALPNQ
jgi:alkanesulfonate monooxygenase SsuD/methylene tetrahydromethanopterin reductase-like flavin-dependent oxidoreductase (luciferase family)